MTISACETPSNCNRTEETRSRNVGLPCILQRLTSLFGLLILLPFLLLIFMLIKTESRGPGIYRQTRIGEHGRRFHFYKFRSMYLDTDPKYRDTDSIKSDREGACKKYKNDPRVTRIGRFLRTSSLDELPQLFNVVKGDMLLVGPRPALCEEVNAYNRIAMNRLNIKPGITGLWQISGRADTTFEEQVDLDIRYIHNQNWLTDIEILLSTIPAVINGKGAY